MYTHHNNELTIEDEGKDVRLKGFVQRARNLGNLVFVDLRDEEGITQLAFDADNPLRDEAAGLKAEYVIEAEGKVRERSSKNKDLPTGDIEVSVTSFRVLSEARQPPMLVRDETDALEEVRLRHRYLDLRRPRLKKFMKLRHLTVKATRDFLNEEGFMEFETPILTKSTPEGARDYIVPSRLDKHHFYALPQSPQLFKQLLMIGGFERYYQIARCFRDEDLRSDRQPEFTQIDIEMAFIDQEAVIDLTERLMARIVKETKGVELQLPFPRMTYEEALRDYGTDKPDTRYGMKIVDTGEIFAQSHFKVFKNVLAQGGAIRGINAENLAGAYSRKDLDRLTKEAERLGAAGLVHLKKEAGEIKSPVAKFLSEEEKGALVERMRMEEGDLVLLVADEEKTVRKVLGRLRNIIAKEQGLADADHFDFHWVVEWPMFAYDEEAGRYHSLHHPFTRVQDEDRDKLATDPTAAKAYGYDLVVQGYELGGGSLRIHDMKMQSEVFNVLSIDEATQKERFGFLLDALSYGTPPHGGIALGLERLLMVLGQTENIRDVIAFPKTQSGHCLLTGAPSGIDREQWRELGLQKEKKREE